ncbi:hypothetical protein [Aliiroseovarius sp. S253]|uniref:hypothetical protein n=1 Tax=Aliiroseovarius sp. S253 TaxID=3415133 RepID=UPI003C7EB42C
MNTSRVLNYVAFPVLVIAALLGLYWVWGLLFLWWIVPAISTGQSHLVFEVNRDEDPVLFWAVTTLWALFGLMMFAASLFPQYSHWLV